MKSAAGSRKPACRPDRRVRLELALTVHSLCCRSNAKLCGTNCSGSRAWVFYRIRRMRILSVGRLFCLCLAACRVPPPSRGGPVRPTHVSVLTGEQVIQILDETVDWYRTLGAQQQSATQPSDLLILYANQQTADKVIGLAFELARANAELLSSEAGTAGEVDATQALSEQQKRLDAQRKGDPG